MAVFQLEAAKATPKRLKTPSPNPQPFQQTPTTETHKTHIEYLKTQWIDVLCLQAPLTPSYYQSLAKYEKYSSMKVLQAQLIKEQEVKKSRDKQDRIRRKSGSNQHAQKNGVIYKGTAVRQIEEWKQEVVNQALKRLCKEKDKVWKKLMKELLKLVEDGVIT